MLNRERDHVDPWTVRRRLLALASLLVLLAPASAPARVPDGWIIGGTTAPEQSHPWQVALVVDGMTPTRGQFCGGTLVSQTRVVTAAHCVMSTANAVRPASSVDVFANATNLLDPAGFRADVASISVHPQADMSAQTPRRDAAVLTLATPVPAAQPVDIVAASGSSQDVLWAPGRPLGLAGWGAVGYTPGRVPVFPSQLQETELSRVSDATCAAGWDALFSATDMVCASAPSRDSCNGDSGGGLHLRTTARAYRWSSAPWRLVGIVSWGASDCDDPGAPPGVYTRVAAPAIRSYLTSSTPGAPAAGGAPAFTGSPVVGETLHCASPGWSPAEVSEQFEVYRVDGSASPVRLSTGTQDHLITTADLGADLVCLASARTAGGQAAVESAARGPVTEPAAVVQPATTGEPAPTPPPDTRTPTVEPIAPGPSTTPSGRVDTAPPHAAVLGRRVCRARRCTLTVLVTDPAPSSGVASVRARIGFRRRGRRVTRTLVARRIGGSRFSLTTPRLPRGTYRLRLTAVDRAGNAQRLPSTVLLRVR